MATAPDTWSYKGWSIEVDPKPISVRNFDWSATSPDYDCDTDSDGDFQCAGEIVYAATYEELLQEIEDCILEMAA
jgi:hypothetical protein